jgi:hypothetical protein
VTLVVSFHLAIAINVRGDRRESGDEVNLLNAPIADSRRMLSRQEAIRLESGPDACFGSDACTNRLRRSPRPRHRQLS